MQQGGTVLSHWHHLEDDFATSGESFYQAVEAAVRERQVPDVTFSREEFREFHVATAKRDYLRLKRGLVVFDLCAAPYGTGYFVSWWLVQLGPKHPILYLLAFLLLVMAVPGWLASNMGLWGLVWYPVLVVLMLAGLVYLARSGVLGPEEHIIAIPVAGWVYRTFFKPLTYYSSDTALMFKESVGRAVAEHLSALLEEQGHAPLSEEAKRPTMRDLALL